jgi:hypothetical protein
MVLLAIATAGCGKSNNQDRSAKPPPNALQPAAEAILKAWEQGDSPAAIRQFIEADWSAKPFFAPGSAMNLSEDQFKQLPAVEREAKSADVQAQLAELKKLAGAVVQAGRDAAAKKDLDGARKHFAAVQQCGQALASPDSMLIVQLVGKALQKMALAETDKLPQ